MYKLKIEACFTSLLFVLLYCCCKKDRDDDTGIKNKELFVLQE
jgi:hypothetical protein